MRVLTVDYKARVISVGSLLICAGCSGPFGDDEVRTLGAVRLNDLPVVINVPEEVDRDMPFAVSVRTYGGGCERVGPTESRISGDTIFVTPYDFTAIGRDCGDVLRIFEHLAEYSWAAEGPLTVVVRGVEKPSGMERTYSYEVRVL